MKKEQTRVSVRGQVVIPRGIREDLGIKAGQELIVEEIDGVILMAPKGSDYLKELGNLGKRLKMGDMRRDIKGSRRDSRWES